MRKINISNKKAAMEMSMGTVVTIVLLMSVLVLGIFLIQKIFSVGTSAIDGIDTKIQGEINEMFADEGEKVIIYPKETTAGGITIKKGKTGGFGISIMNIKVSEGVFSYTVDGPQIAEGCQLSPEQAQKLIILGDHGEDIRLPSGDKMSTAIFVKFSIPEATPLCQIRYAVNVLEGGNQYLPTIFADLEIVS